VKLIYAVLGPIEPPDIAEKVERLRRVEP